MARLRTLAAIVAGDVWETIGPFVPLPVALFSAIGVFSRYTQLPVTVPLWWELSALVPPVLVLGVFGYVLLLLLRDYWADVTARAEEVSRDD